MQIPFIKMHGLGNDYIYLYNPIFTEEKLPVLTKQISHRHYGVGGDGLVCILPSHRADFCMRIFNSDGTEAEMCGNAIRCVGKFVFEKGYTKKKYISVETLAGIKNLQLYTEISNGKEIINLVRVDMGEPILEAEKIPVLANISPVIHQSVLERKREFFVTAVSMGNPHAVVFTDFSEEDFWGEKGDKLINVFGKKLECHPIFPKKANVEFVKVMSNTNILMRVWERGAGETMACGTGASAATVACILNRKTGNKVHAQLLGGRLAIEWNKKTNHVFMTGGADFVCEGIYFFEE